jgi:hypothetical protein
MKIVWKNPSPPINSAFAVSLDSVADNSRTYYAVFASNSSTLLQVENGRKFSMSAFLRGTL